MAKYYGRIGFITTKETSPGVWTQKIVTRKYRGDVMTRYIRWDNAEKINDDLNINNTLSIIADSFCYEHLGTIRFVEWMGSLWEINSIEVQRPRLNLTIGGVYNGPDPDEEDTTPEDTGGDSGE